MTQAPYKSTQPRIRKNCAACPACGEIVESTYRHDYRTCGCGAIAVDGGLDYLRRTWKDPNVPIEMSEYED